MDEGPMTPEEKAMVMQFMGQTYGAVHKQDQGIVGNSGNLSPKSQELKAIFEQTARLPTVHPDMVNQQQGPPPQPVQQPVQPPVAPAPEAPVQVQPVTPEQAAQEIAAATAPPVQSINTNQEEFDFSEPSKFDQLISLVEKQTLILKEISLKLSNGKSVKTNKQK